MWMHQSENWLIRFAATKFYAFDVGLREACIIWVQSFSHSAKMYMNIFYKYFLVQMNLISNDGHRSKPQQDIDFWSAPIQIKISSYNLEVRIGSELEPFWCQFCSRVVQSMFGQIGGDSVFLHGSDLIVRTELLNWFQLMSRVWFYSDGHITRTKFLTISKLL